MKKYGQRKKIWGLVANELSRLMAVYPKKKVMVKRAAILFNSSSSSGCAVGRFSLGLVQDDGTLDWKYNYSINGSAYYAYSCLTILPDGTIGLLCQYGNCDYAKKILM